MITLDGYFEGPNRDISWHNVDEEFNDFAIQQLNETDLLLFGRVTYELMASYWPTPSAIKNDPIVAGTMNSIAKVVFSRKLTHANWSNTRLIKDRLTEEVSTLKQQSGKDIGIFGSANLAKTLERNGLIDEYRLMLNPVVLGNGKPLFEGVSVRTELNLVRTKMFTSGKILLSYELQSSKRI